MAIPEQPIPSCMPTLHTGQGLRTALDPSSISRWETGQPGRSTAAVGLDDAVLLELSQNGGAGLLVVTDGFGSEARIDSRQIVFSGNAGGATVGNVIDVAVGP